MNKFALIGGKLGHSFSPEIHKLTMEKMGIDGEYSLIEVDSEGIEEVTNNIRDGRLDGINVTIPHKLDVMNYLDEITEEARVIGAVNTVERVGDRLIGHNTDYWGFRYTVEKQEINLKEKKCVVLGGGGSARAVIKVAIDLGASVYLVSRSPEKAKETFGNFQGLEIISYEELKELDGELIVNTTPLGMYPNVESCAVNEEVIKRYKNAIDLIYNPKETVFLKRGNRGENGLYMLVGQAVRAQEIWQKQELESFGDIYRKIEEVVYK